MEITYLLREDGDDMYTLSKWEDGKVPNAIYRVSLKPGKNWCTCPSGSSRGYCKHTDMVRKMVEQDTHIATVRD